MTVKIPGKIVDSQYLGTTEEQGSSGSGAEPWSRPPELSGKTYRIDPATGPSGYLTINDDEHGQPRELFYNSRDQSRAAWVMATTRLASRALQWGIPPEEVVKDMTRIDDPDGGYWVRGRWVGSLVAHIGTVLAEHAAAGPEPETELDEPAENPIATYEAPKAKKCPVCGEYASQWLDGCWTCTACGHSKCG